MIVEVANLQTGAFVHLPGGWTRSTCTGTVNQFIKAQEASRALIIWRAHAAARAPRKCAASESASCTVRNLRFARKRLDPLVRLTTYWCSRLWPTSSTFQRISRLVK